ncbi:MAG: hypothetical protein AAF772_07795 [Acidobacteriota bacterium]
MPEPSTDLESANDDAPVTGAEELADNPGLDAAALKPLVADASCLLNLIATDRAVDMLQALGHTLVISPAVPRERLLLIEPGYEVGTMYSDELPRQPIDLGPLHEAGLLRGQALEAEMIGPFVRCAELLPDEDAEAVAIAACLGLPLLTDDRRQRFVGTDLFPRLRFVSTLDLMIQACEALGLDDAAREAMVRDVRNRANYLPDRHDPQRAWFFGAREPAAEGDDDSVG